MGKHWYAVEAAIGVIALAFLPFRPQVSAGLVVGAVFSWIYLWFLALRVDGIIVRKRVGAMVYLGTLAGIALLSIPLYLSVRFPQYLSWQGVLVGLLARKAVLYVQAFRGGAHDD